MKTTQTSDGTSFNVVAYAAGTPGDPSTARRLSLSRALVVRGALISSGISSSHIYVRALGASEGGQTPDRVDVAVLGANAPSRSREERKTVTRPKVYLIRMLVFLVAVCVVAVVLSPVLRAPINNNPC